MKPIIQPHLRQGSSGKSNHSMSRATRLINRLDKVLARHDSFGDDPAAFVDKRLPKSKSSLSWSRPSRSPNTGLRFMWSGSCPDQEQVLNRVMARGAESID